MATASMTACPTSIDGILNVNKAPGWTSHDVVVRVRGLLQGRRVGHAGTLDPAATGVLPVLVGRATRLADYLMEWDKEYRAVLRLGETTDTLDATGTVLSRRATEGVTDGDVRAAVARFQGRLTQVPPMYSAVKVGGVPLYKAARAGRTIAREARPVTVHAIQILDIAGPEVSLAITCSKGTYVRSLCADIGEVLGVGAHLRALVRTRVGPLHLAGALTIEEIETQLAQGTGLGTLWPLDRVLEARPVVDVTEEVARRMVHGVAVPFGALHAAAGLDAIETGAVVCVKDPRGRLIALGAVAAEGSDRVIRVRRVLVDADAYDSSRRPGGRIEQADETLS